MEFFCKIKYGEEMDTMRFGFGHWFVPCSLRAWRIYEVDFESRHIILKRCTWGETLEYWRGYARKTLLFEKETQHTTS